MLRKKKSLVDRAVDSASDAIDAALPVIESAVTQVREQAPEVSKAAAEGAKELAIDAKSIVAPLVAAGLAGAAELAASGRDMAAAKAADLKGEPPKRKGSKFRKLLFWGTVAAAAGFVYQKVRPTPETDNWQSAYTPPTSAGSTSSTTSATGSAAAGTGGAHLAPGVGPDEPLATDDPMAKLAAEEATNNATGDDSGGADPAEAIADAAEEPHDITTPDDPADVVEVEDKAAKKK